MDIKSYEEATKELEQLVEQLENESISIDELAPKLERAAALIKYCREKLKTTESKVEAILKEIS